MKRIYFYIIIILASTQLFAQYHFVENKGQWPKNVSFRVNYQFAQIYFEKNCFTYNLLDEKSLPVSEVHHGYNRNTDIIKGHAYRMTFLNANPDLYIAKSKRSSDYSNYYIGKKENWASKAYSYKSIRYEELYKGIDLDVHYNNSGIKYDFIVTAGADPNQIKIKYEGVDKLKIDKNKLVIETSVGKIVELEPYVYQKINGQNIKIPARYKLKNNILSFKIDSYYSQYDLIIDPVLIFSTYSGSTSDNWGFTATFDSKGNVYSGGVVFGSGYPASLGAYQYNFNGGEYVWTYVPNGCDIAIIKYNSTGNQRLWATYLGGAQSEEMPHSLVVNNSDELYIFGTTSSPDFPTTAGAYDQTFNGGTSFTYDNVIKYTQGSDIFISKLNEDGTQLLASTFVGGSGNDGINYKAYINSNGSVLMHGNDSLYFNYADGARGEIIVDDKSDVYVATSTFSTDFPVPNGFQNSNHGGQEGVIFKLNGTLTSMFWGSYLGGSQDDAIYSVDVDNNNDVYVGGGTVSHDFPTTQGTYSPNFNGGTTDGFVAHISADGQNLIASTYFGAQDYDQVYFVRLDRAKNIYVTGQTKNPGSALIFNAGYNSPNSGQFVTKFTNDLGGLIYSTTFGTGSGRPNISITAFSVDVCNRIYLSGWGREWPDYNNYTWNGPNGTTGMDITTNAYQSSTDAQDFYIMVMHDDASTLDYATFFGEQHSSGYCGHDHVDGGTSRFDKKGHIYQSVCASCGNYGQNFNSPSCNDFPTTPGVWSENNGGTVDSLWECNNAVFSFSFVDDITVADFHFPGNGCAPYDVQFTNSGMGNSFFWDFGDGTTSTLENPTHTFSEGTWDIMLIATDSGTCNISDTIVKTIHVGQTTYDTLDIKHICIGDSVQIGINENLTGVTYSWTPVNGLSDTSIANPLASPVNSTVYHLSSNYNSCREITQEVIVHNNNLSVIAYPDTGVCVGEDVTFYVDVNDSTVSYQWYEINTPGNILSNVDSLQVTVNQDVQYVVSVNEQYCGITQTDTVNASISPLNIMIASDTVICYGDTVHLFAGSYDVNDTLTFSWQPVSAIISGENTATPEVAPTQNTVYYVEATNQNLCSGTDSILVMVDSLYGSLTALDVSCYAFSDGSINATANGFSPYQYIWNTGDNTQNISNLPAGTYTLTLTDSAGCSIVLTETITQPPLLVAQITDIQQTGCGSMIESGSATVNATGGTPGYTYNWSSGDTTETASALAQGNYTVTVSDSHLCDTVLQVQISDPSTLVISETHIDALCFGDCNGSAQINIDSASTPPYSYHWQNGETESSIGNLCFGTYSVSVFDADTCMRRLVVAISQPDSIFTQINSNGIVCHNDLASATAQVISGGTPDFSYTWSTGENGQSVDNLTEGEYFVVVTDAHDCKDTTYLHLVNPPELVIDSSQTQATCNLACNATALVSVSGGVPEYQYLWTDGSTDSVASGLCTGLSSVTVTDANMCTKVIDFQIEVSAGGLLVDAWADKYIIYNDESTSLHTVQGDGYSYVWSPSSSLDDYTSQNPEASPKTTTLYTVTVTDEFGCSNIDTVLIKVKEIICGEPYIYVPNAFTPNGDNKNDILYAYGDIIDDLYFAVYDRWGELMFETTDITKGWDGTYHGKKLDPAVFVYYIKAICRNNETFIKRGNVTLLR